MSDNKKQQLMDMGFDAARADEALTVCEGNMERAIGYLFSEPQDPPVARNAAALSSASSAAASLKSNHQDVVASMSQYTLPQGRSACTCIALTAAQEFLSHPAVGTATPEFLENAIKQGVQVYGSLNQTKGGGVEHMSAEEVLAVSNSGGGAFSKMQLTPGGIRQGILQANDYNNSNPLGMHALLSACRQDAPSKDWCAVLITKTPETVLAILPPTEPPQKIQNVVVDSHPRPGVVSGQGAYARLLTSLEDVVVHLNTILPATQLGPDIPEMMAAMYNSFDLYPLVLKK